MTFQVDTPVDYVLTGMLTASCLGWSTATSSLQLDGPSGSVYDGEIYAWYGSTNYCNESLPIQQSGTLETGFHTLDVSIIGSGRGYWHHSDPETAYDGFSQGDFDFELSTAP